jgi:hypothetical protein
MNKEDDMSDIQQKDVGAVYCSSCETVIFKEAEIFPKCGVVNGIF